MKTTTNFKFKKKNGTCPRTPERTGKGQHRDTNNNDNNIYLYLLNKYKVESRQNFSEYMKKVKELRNDEKWDLLTKEEQVKIISEI